MINSIIQSQITMGSFIACLVAALVLGVLTSVLFTAKEHHTKTFAVALALLPAIVCVVIMLVNGNIGAGIAVAGTFALVRFRSAPGNAKELTGLFFAVAMGLCCGMGYITIAAISYVIIAAVLLILTAVGFGSNNSGIRILKISIPENLDYEEIFDDLFAEYAISCELVKVKTSNMGTIFDLTYEIVLKDKDKTKAFLDQIRCRNGNLNVSCQRPQVKDDVM